MKNKYSARQVADKVDAHYNTILRWISNGVLIPDKVVNLMGTSRYYFELETLNRLKLRLKIGV